MRFLSSVIAASSLIASAAATGVMLPLYVDPGENGAKWKSVQTAAQDASVKWTIVVNPNNGPGGAPSDSYTAGMASIDLPNILSVGYIHTSWAARSASLIQSDLDAWKSWGSQIKGIFYDETSADNTTNIKEITDMARQTLGSDTMTICNFGAKALDEMYEYCSVVVGFESAASSFKGTTTLDDNFTGGKENQGAVIVHSFSGDASQMKDYFTQMNTAGIAWGFFCAAADYNTATELIAENAAAAAGGDAPSSPSSPSSPSQSTGTSTGTPVSTDAASSTGFVTSFTTPTSEPSGSASVDPGTDESSDTVPADASITPSPSPSPSPGRGHKKSSGGRNSKSTDTCSKKHQDDDGDDDDN